MEGSISKFIEGNECFCILAYLSYEVLIGYVQDRTLYFYDRIGLDFEHLLELRIFNENKELHIVKYGEAYIARVREDGVGLNEEVYDEIDAVFGTHIEPGKSSDRLTWSLLVEDRGTKIAVPFKFSNNINDTQLYYKVRNYIDKENPNLVFTDARLCGFFNNQLQALGVEQNG